MKSRRYMTVVLVALACLTAPLIAHGATAADLQARLADIKQEFNAAGKAYDEAHWALDETDVEIERLDKRIADTDVALAAAKTRLNERAGQMYRRDGAGLLNVILGATSFEEFVTTYDYLSRIGTADSVAVSEVKGLRAQLADQRRALDEKRNVQAADLKRLKSRRTALDKKMRSQQAEYDSVRKQLAAVRSGGTVPAGVAAAAGPNGMVFPVAGSNYYSDTWGASRSGGRRRHQGTDIMASTGTPLVATMSGTVRSKTGGLGGKTIWLTGSNGWQFYYAHLNSITVSSGSVKAGQVIGTVGATGNAAGGSPHLHFEIHPGGGGPVNPYPYLRRME